METKTLSNIYNSDRFHGKCRNIRVKIKGYSDPFDLELVDMRTGTPDCVIGHFGYNFYLRTPYGIHAKRYKTPQSLKKAVIRVAKNNGLEVEYFTYNPNDSYKHRIINL